MEYAVLWVIDEKEMLILSQKDAIFGLSGFLFRHSDPRSGIRAMIFPSNSDAFSVCPFSVNFHS